MSQKNKKSSIQDNIQDIAAQVGTVAMTGAMVLGVAQLAGVDSKPITNYVVEAIKAGEHHKEVGPHHISYGATQRTAARSGA